MTQCVYFSMLKFIQTRRLLTQVIGHLKGSHFAFPSSSLQAILNGNVQVTMILGIRTTRQRPTNNVPSLAAQILGQVKDGLFPVRRLVEGTGPESDHPIAPKLNIKVRQQSVAVIGPVHFDAERDDKGQILLFDRANVDGLEDTLVLNDALGRHNIDQWLVQSQRLDTAHVEAVHVVPVVNLLFLVLGVLDGRNQHGCLIGKDSSPGDQVAITSVQHRIQHRLVNQKVSHPLGDDNVDLRNGQLDFLHLPLQQDNLVLEAVGLDDLASLLNDPGHVDADDQASTGLSREHAQDTRATANVQDDLVLEEVAIAEDGVSVAHGADFILQHFLVNAKVSVRVKVVITGFGKGIFQGI